MVDVRWSFGGVAAGASVAPPSPTLQVGRVFADRYQVLEVLGRGAGGVVYLAEDRALGRRVAIKLLSRSLEESQRQRFVREGELTASLAHPGIGGVHGGGVTADGRPFLVLELIEGARPLDEVLGEVGAEAGLDLLEQVARAVGFAHGKGVVHRDLKPENVLVDASGHPRVCDFGIAWREDVDRLTQTGAMIGTPSYMPPEQFGVEGRKAPAPTADVWSLGVMLYEHLTGELPFPATQLLELMASVLESHPTPPSSLNPHIPKAIGEVCLRALARAPGDRYSDGVALADALASARRAAVGGRKWRAGVAIAVTALLLALGVALVSSEEQSSSPRRQSRREARRPRRLPRASPLRV